MVSWSNFIGRRLYNLTNPDTLKASYVTTQSQNLRITKMKQFLNFILNVSCFSSVLWSISLRICIIIVIVAYNITFWLLELKCIIDWFDWVRVTSCSSYCCLYIILFYLRYINSRLISINSWDILNTWLFLSNLILKQLWLAINICCILHRWIWACYEGTLICWIIFQIASTY